MMSIGMLCVISTFMVISYGCPQLCGAQDLTCTVTQADDRTVYNISDVSHASDVKEFDCYYSWTNQSNHVLANQAEKMAGLVLRNAIDNLVTSKCFESMILTRHCVSEVTERKAHCTTNCSIMKINEDKTKMQNEEIPFTWIALVVVIPLLVVVLGILCCVFREKIKGLCSCSNYSAVKMYYNNSRHGAVEVIV